MNRFLEIFVSCEESFQLGEKVKVLAPSPVGLSDPVDCSPPGSSVPGVF